MLYEIVDWMNNKVVTDPPTFATFQDGWDWIYTNVPDEDNAYDDLFVQPVPAATPTPTYHKGIAYYASYEDAATVRDIIEPAYPDSRIVAYQLGYAVQYRKSGGYFPS